MTTTTEAMKPIPRPPAYSNEARLMAEKHHVDPRLVQQMIDQGVIKVD